MANEKETVENILAEMRKNMNPNGTAECQYLESDICTLADRIEVAWKREARAIATEHAVLPAVCITRPSGNAAAMREAAVTVYNVLEKIRTFSLHIGDIGHKREFTHLVCLAKNRLDAALSVPARNCDLYKNKKDAEAAFISEECKHPCGDCTVSEYGCALVHECGVDWLLAQAERKGEGDGCD